MKVILTILLFVFSIANSISQNADEKNLRSNFLHPEVTKHTKEIDETYDFQLRFWINNSSRVPDTKNLFVMTQKEGNWLCASYIARQKWSKHRKHWDGYKVKTQKIHNIDADSIWRFFIENKLLELPDMSALRYKFNKKATDGREYTIEVMDGETYTFEFLTPNSYRRISYHCPAAYAQTFDHIPQLKFVSNIIELIGKIIQREGTPC